jgi:hypothetical protein
MALPKILPGTGRGTARSVVEGSQLPTCTALSPAWAPSVAARHLPVPGRILRAATAFAPLVALTLGGCSGDGPMAITDNEAIKTCESFTIARLKSPSSYKRIEADSYDAALPANLYAKAIAKSDDKTRNVDNPRQSISPGIRTVFIKYDASNTYGALIREMAQCSFVLSELKSGQMLQPIAPSVAEAMGEGSAMLESVSGEGDPCCLTGTLTQEELSKALYPENPSPNSEAVK